MSWWVVSANGTASGPMEELDARIEHTRLIGKGAHADTLRVVRAASKPEALSQKPR